MSDKTHHLTGKASNNAKPLEEKKLASIHMRIHPDTKSLWIEAAREKKLSEFISDAVDFYIKNS